MAHCCSWLNRFHHQRWINWAVNWNRPCSLFPNPLYSLQQSKLTVYFYTTRKTRTENALLTNPKLDSFLTGWRFWWRSSRRTYHTIKSSQFVPWVNRIASFWLFQWFGNNTSRQTPLSLFHSKYFWFLWTCLNWKWPKTLLWSCPWVTEAQRTTYRF